MGHIPSGEPEKDGWRDYVFYVVMIGLLIFAYVAAKYL